MLPGQTADLIAANFPVEPLPGRFFVRENFSYDEDPYGDFHDRVEGRPWIDVTFEDWLMTGMAPNVSREYLYPSAFTYYLPSLISGVFRQPDHIQFALEAIIPLGRARRPRGAWWNAFASGLTDPQRATLSAFLATIRLMYWESIGEADRALVEDGEKVWGVWEGTLR